MDTNLIERVSVLQCRLNQISSKSASGLEFVDQVMEGCLRIPKNSNAKGFQSLKFLEAMLSNNFLDHIL